jgi:hypothetical protein
MSSKASNARLNSESRTITLNFNEVENMELHREIGEPEFVEQAIGYLSTWNMTFPRVVISRDGPTDLIAHYYHEDGTHGYTIGVIWHDNHYSYHS